MRLRVIGATCVLVLTVCAPVLAGSSEDGNSHINTELFGRTIFNTHYDNGLQKFDFSSYLTEKNTKRLSFNVRDTRIGFRAHSKSGAWKFRAVFEADFYGSNSGNSLLPRLRLGYAEADNGRGLSIRGGQDWIPVAQQLPGCIDFGILSWSGNLWARVPQMTVRLKTANVEYLASAMKHRPGNERELQETMPWVLGRVALSDMPGDGWLFAVGGGWRSVTIDAIDYEPYVVALEFRAPISGTPFALNGEFYRGRGLGGEFVHYGLDYNPSHPVGGREIRTNGGFVDLEVRLTRKVRMHLGYGRDDPSSDDLVGAQDVPYWQNDVAYAAVKIYENKNFGWGFEVLNYNTDRGPEGMLVGQRFTSSWWYIF